MTTLNARVGACALVAGPLGQVLLGTVSTDLAALNLLALGITAFGAWCLADEMGSRKPLNRAGLLALALAVFAKLQASLGPEGASQSAFVLLYVFSILLAVLFWSIAFLHRNGTVRRIGAIGALGAFVPLLVLVAGHVFVGLGAFFGVAVLYRASGGGASADASVLTVLHVLIAVWSLLAAWLLWSGLIGSSGTPKTGASRPESLSLQAR
ncbi:hypothetical protein [Roseibium sp. Sym1]|uniref:hypothetical protein n=1 Tax=Roseibium sp. Sym1 TaxID=3016006 RepID=UPI0022B2C0CC|nr:hypothetical protein [Roseibium sp. Sym1]